MGFFFWLLGLLCGGDCYGLFGSWDCCVVVIVMGFLVVGIMWWCLLWAFWLLGLLCGGDCYGLFGCWDCCLVVIVMGFFLVVSIVMWWCLLWAFWLLGL